MPRSSSTPAAAFIVGQSDWLPMMIPISTVMRVPFRRRYNRGRPWCNRPKANDVGQTPSGDDVGQKLVLDVPDPVLECEFLLLQAPDCQRVAGGLGFERLDRLVEIAVFHTQGFEPGAQHLFRLHLDGWGHVGTLVFHGPKLDANPACCNLRGLRDASSTPIFMPRVARTGPGNTQSLRKGPCL